MKSKSLILIAIALGCGLVASIGISQVMGRGGTETEVVAEPEMVKILVATKDLSIGDELTAENVMLKSWPEEHLPEGFISDIDEVKSKYPNARLLKGSPILHTSLMDQHDKKIIPPGFRVIPIKVAADMVSNLVLPGDHIDIVVLLSARGDVSEAMAMTVLRDVIIFDVNGHVERVVEEGGKTVNVKTVSLLLKPRDVNLIALADSMGKLRLSLRRPPGEGEEYHDDMNTTIRLSDVLNPDRQSNNSTLPPSGLEALLPNGPEQTVPVDNQPLADVKPVQSVFVPTISAPPQPPAFEMLVRGPSDVTRYVWHDEKQLPVVEPLNNGPSIPAMLQTLPVAQSLLGNGKPLNGPGVNNSPVTVPTGEITNDESEIGDAPQD